MARLFLSGCRYVRRGMGGHASAFLLCGAGLIFFLRVVMAVWMPPVPDEAYYWLWSRHLQGGYLDHPFMIAVWIRLGTWIWGDTALGMRFVGLAGFALANFFLFSAVRRFFPKRDHAGLHAVSLLNATLMGGIGLLPATPDMPLFFFLIMALWALSHILPADGAGEDACVRPMGWAQTGWWLCCGISLGLAVASKYTAILWGVGLAGFVLFSRGRYWQQVGPWLGAMGAVIVTLPVLDWNYHHHWVGLLKQGGRISQWHPARAGQFLAEFLGGQLALLTPWVAALCLLGMWRARRGNGLLLWLSLPAIGVFLLHVTGDRIQPNWVWVVYPTLILAGAGYVRRVGAAVLSGQFCVLLVMLQSLTGVISLPAHLNPVLRLSAGWDRLAVDLAAQARQAGFEAIVTDDYALASILAFYNPKDVVVLGQDFRWAWLAGLPHRRVKTALFVRDGHYGPVQTGRWMVQRYGQGHMVRVYQLERRDKLSGWEIR